MEFELGAFDRPLGEINAMEDQLVTLQDDALTERAEVMKKEARAGVRLDRLRAPLFALGAHPFLTLTLFIAMFERDNTEPLEFQKEYGRRLAHMSLPLIGLPFSVPLPLP